MDQKKLEAKAGEAPIPHLPGKGKIRRLSLCVIVGAMLHT